MPSVSWASLKTCEILDIAKSSLRRYLAGKRKIPEDVLGRALQFHMRSEFESIVVEWNKLGALGIIEENGVVDYGLALSNTNNSSRDECFKNAILWFVV